MKLEKCGIIISWEKWCNRSAGEVLIISMELMEAVRLTKPMKVTKVPGMNNQATICSKIEPLKKVCCFRFLYMVYGCVYLGSEVIYFLTGSYSGFVTLWTTSYGWLWQLRLASYVLALLHVIIVQFEGRESSIDLLREVFPPAILLPIQNFLVGIYNSNGKKFHPSMMLQNSVVSEHVCANSIKYDLRL